MKLPVYQLRFQRLDLKYVWAISRNSTDYKNNAFIRIADREHVGIGEAAPNVRYNESVEEFERVFASLSFEAVASLGELVDYLERERIPNALRFGIESAYVHYLVAKQGGTVSDFFGLASPVPKTISYTVPIMPIELVESYFESYSLGRFTCLKLKVNDQNMLDLVREIERVSDAQLIIDANEAYRDPDHLLKDLEELKSPRIKVLEQPFPAGFDNEYRYLKATNTIPVFADESVTDKADFEMLKECFDGVNVKLMKAGGYLNAIRLLKEAKRHGLQTMIGCMVETGLGISAGFHLSSLADYLDLDSFLILKEDPYPFVKEEGGILFWNNGMNSPEFSLNSPF